MVRVTFALLALLAPASAFHAAPGTTLGRLTAARRSTVPAARPSERLLESFDPLNVAPVANPEQDALNRAASGLGLASMALLAMPSDALAKGGEYGLCEGRIISLAHPAVMGFCFLVSLGSLYSGIQWRRLREIGGEISELKSTLSTPSKQLEALKAIEGEPSAADAVAIADLTAQCTEIEAQISTLTGTRKELAAKDYRDRHWAQGSILLGLGVSFAIEGPVNTYMRAGKLFPGPHVYAGVACTCLWALAAAMVPQMQKGKEWARTSHISMNVISTALFAYYQIPTGLQIAQKVIEKTKFP